MTTDRPPIANDDEFAETVAKINNEAAAMEARSAETGQPVGGMRDLSPIVDAVRAARSMIESSDPAAWAARILDGDQEAFVAGVRLMQQLDQLIRESNLLIGLTEPPAGGRRPEFDDRAFEAALGATAVVDAMLIARGEVDSDDPVIQARFKPARLQLQRIQLEKWIAMVEQDGGDTSFYRAQLALIDAGIEPE